MDKKLEAAFLFQISAFRFTKHGGLKMVLDIGEDQAEAALKLALKQDALFSGDFFLVENKTFGGKSA